MSSLSYSLSPSPPGLLSRKPRYRTPECSTCHMDVKSQKIDGDSDYPRQHAMILFSSCAEKNDIDAVDIILRITQLHHSARSVLNKHCESPIEQLLSSDKMGCLLIVQSIPAISSHQWGFERIAANSRKVWHHHQRRFHSIPPSCSLLHNWSLLTGRWFNWESVSLQSCACRDLETATMSWGTVMWMIYLNAQWGFRVRELEIGQRHF